MMGSFRLQTFAWIGVRVFFGAAIVTSSFAATPQGLVEKAKAKNLSSHPQWVNLIHYRSGWFGGNESQADGKKFFLAADGKWNSQAELEATLNGFFRQPTAEELKAPEQLSDAEIQARLKEMQEHRDHPSADHKPTPVEEIAPIQHPICQFPARLRFLKRELDWSGEELPKVTCVRLDEFRKRLDAQSVSLVFSSFYMSNPSSTFGHSFLRINSGLWSQYGNYRNELLDTGINYAANPYTSNPFLYAAFGMMGLFPGTFTAVPYYYKVREYNDFESRDLWSYDLNLTAEEVKMLIDHIWEEGSTYYDYFYFTENCSYHMFTLLDAAAPRLQLANRLPFYVIPSDTIRVLNQVPGLVSRVTYRPSILSQFKYRVKTLSAEEEEALRSVIAAGDPDQIKASLSKESVARILDAYSDLIEFNSAKELLRDGSDAQKLKQKILVKRSALGVQSPSLVVPTPEKNAPQSAHGTRRISLGFANEEDEGSAEVVGFKFAMHELLDPGIGYPRNMQIDFGQVRFRYLNRPEGFRKQFQFDEIGLFKIAALTPWSPYYSSNSVRAEVGWKKSVDTDCKTPDHRCLPLAIEYAPGLAYDPTGSESVTFFGFAQVRGNYSPSYRGSDFRLGAGPKLGSLLHFSDNLRFMVTTEIMARLFAQRSLTFASEANLRFGFYPRWAIDLAGKQDRDFREAVSQIHYYF